MSDRDDLDTADLDAAFDRLSADVDSRTRAPGANRAIRTAGRRRLAAAAGALAVVAVLAAVLIGTLGPLGLRSAPPVATPMTDPLPAPRSLDATAFNEATAGWTSGWTEGAPVVPIEPPCDPAKDLPEPLDSVRKEFRAGTSSGATHTVERFDSYERAFDSIFKKYSHYECRGDYVELKDEIWNGGESYGFGYKVGGQIFYELLVVHQTGTAVLWVVGAGEMPEEVRKRLVLALLADLRT